MECICTTVDVAAVQLNDLSMDPRHLPAPGGRSDGLAERMDSLAAAHMRVEAN